MLRLRTEGIVAAAATAAPPEVERPETYNDFVGVGSSTDYGTINAALAAGEKLIFLRQGTHTINNPIVINTSEAVYIHGYADIKTVLKAQNVNQPMFIVQNCPLLNVQRIELQCAGALGVNANQIGFDFQNTASTRAEFAQLDFTGLMPANIEGPGDYILQNVNFVSHNQPQASIIVDHPGASFWYINGHSFGNSETEHLLQNTTNEIYHIWQKRGHVEIYNLLLVASRGEGADLRFDTRSPKGAHVVAGMRSEGCRNIEYPGGSAHADGIFSHLIYVPPTAEQVDLLVMANELDGTFDLQDPNPALKFVPDVVRYNGRGTAWLFNNVCRQADSLVSGSATNATIIAAGNGIMRGDTSDVTGASKVAIAGNLQHRWTANEFFPELPASPAVDFIETAALETFAPLPAPPARGPLPVVTTPRVETLHPFLELKNVKSYGAVGDGSTDDTAALQAAIDDAGDRLFFPAGTYRTTAQLALHYNPGALGRSEPGSLFYFGFAGGWWAGAGSGATKIHRTNGGRVFITGGMGYWQIQDIAFHTANNSQDNVHMSRQTNFGQAVQTSRVTISNCTFIGGSSCLGWANDFGITGGNINCESMLAVDCTLQDGTRGLDNGRFNAFGNTLFNCTIQNNDFAVRSQQAPCSLLQCSLMGNDRDFQIMCFIRSHYYALCESDSPIIWQQPATGATIDFYAPVFDTWTWTGLNSGSVVMRSPYGHGPALLQCSMPVGRINFTDQFMGVKKVALKLWSTIGEWDASKNQSGQTSAIYHSTD